MAESALDKLTKTGTAYTKVQETNLITSSETSCHYRIVRALDGFSYGSDATVGQVLFSMFIDTDISTELEAIAKRFEYKKFANFILSLVSTAPLGTSSGSIQAGHTTDPANLTWTTGGSNINRSKIVRQQGSIVLRPRDTATIAIETPGPMYTKRVGSRRFTSWGGLSCIVRTVPALGDVIHFAATLTADVYFHRLSVVTDMAISSSTAEVDYKVEATNDVSVITFEHPKAKPGNTAIVQGGMRKLRIESFVGDELADVTRRKAKRFTNFVCRKPGIFEKTLPGRVSLDEVDEYVANVEVTGVFSAPNDIRFYTV